MGTHWTLFFFHPMFDDPEKLRGQIDHLPSFRERGWLGTQIVLAVRTCDDGMNEHLIRRLDLPQMMSTMAFLSAWFLAAFVPQALGEPHKPIGGGRQTTIMAIFGQLPFEGFDVLLLRGDQPLEVVDTLVQGLQGHNGLLEPFAQVLIRLAGLLQFVVFALQRFTQGCLLGSQLFQFVVFAHAATLADGSSSRNCMTHLNSYHFGQDLSPTS